MTSKEITLTVHKAKEIYSTTMGTMDPYCKVYFDSLTTTSQKSNFCAQGGRNPSWDHAFKLNLVGTERVLNVELHHKGLLSDDFIGRAKVTMSQLNELISMEGRPNWYRAYRGSDEKTEAGDIMLSAKIAAPKQSSTMTTTTGSVPLSTTQQPVQQQQQYLKPQPVMAGQPMMQMPVINYQQYPQQQVMVQQQQQPQQQYVQVMYAPAPIQTTNMQMGNVASWQPSVQSHQVLYSSVEKKDPQPAVQLPPGFNTTPQIVYMAVPQYSQPQVQYSQPQMQTQQVQQTTQQPVYYSGQPMMQYQQYQQPQYQQYQYPQPQYQQYQPINYQQQPQVQMPYQPVQQTQAQPTIQMPYVAPKSK